MNNPPRSVHFVIAGGARSPDELTEILGIAPDDISYEGQARVGVKRPKPARDNSWRIIERGNSDADVSELLESIYLRLRSVASKLRPLRDEGWAIVVRVVVYVSEFDEVSASFVLDAEMIALLRDIGAFFEVDMYVDTPSG